MADAEPELYAFRGGPSLSPTEKAVAPRAVATSDAGAAVQPAQAKPGEADYQPGLALEIPPPYDPVGLANLARTSSALRPCIAAISTMKAGFGYQLKPVFDVTGPGADDRIRKALLVERLLRGDQAPPTDEDVAATKVRIEAEMAVEEVKLERFLRHCAVDRSLTQLRKERDHEEEAEGNAHWEVLRRQDGPDGALNGSLAYFRPVPASTVRLRQIDPGVVMWKRRERVTPLSFDEVEIPWRFRSYVQRVAGTNTTYFREYGDPRPRGARTGTVYASMDALRASGEALANELIHWRVFDPDTPYGVPRWISAEFSVGGIKEAEAVNYYYFDGRAIPPGILAVSGGKLKEGAGALVEKTLTDRAAGRAAFYSMMIMEAESKGSDNAGRCRIEWIPLTDGSESDGRFLNYQRAEGIKVQMQFRLPDIIVGRSQEVNKAQAEAAVGFTEQMVIQPLREDEDGFWNTRILEDLGIKWWEFHTNSAVATDPEQQMRLITMAVKDAGTMTPGEGREATGEVFNKKLDPIDAPWTKQPLALTLAGIPLVEPAPGEARATPVTQGVAGQLRELAAHLREGAASGASVDATKARRREAEVVTVDEALWRSLVEENEPR